MSCRPLVEVSLIKMKTIIQIKIYILYRNFITRLTIFNVKEISIRKYMLMSTERTAYGYTHMLNSIILCYFLLH